MRPLLQSALVALLCLSSSAYAQTRELREDRSELHQTRRETRDDRRDRALAAALLRDYDHALARRDRGALRSLDREALRLMDRELEEGRRELRSDRVEVVRSGHELNDSRRDVRAPAPPPAHAEAHREVRDDRRDLRDDRRDARDELRDLQYVRALRADFAGLSGSTHPRSLHRKRALIASFVSRSGRELTQDAGERREDRRERHEDLREARR